MSRKRQPSMRVEHLHFHAAESGESVDQVVQHLQCFAEFQRVRRRSAVVGMDYRLEVGRQLSVRQASTDKRSRASPAVRCRC